MRDGVSFANIILPDQTLVLVFVPSCLSRRDASYDIPHHQGIQISKYDLRSRSNRDPITLFLCNWCVMIRSVDCGQLGTFASIRAVVFDKKAIDDLR